MVFIRRCTRVVKVWYISDSGDTLHLCVGVSVGYVNSSLNLVCLWFVVLWYVVVVYYVD